MKQKKNKLRETKNIFTDFMRENAWITTDVKNVRAHRQIIHQHSQSVETRRERMTKQTFNKRKTKKNRKKPKRTNRGSSCGLIELGLFQW